MPTPHAQQEPAGYADASATEIARLVRSREISAVQVVDDYLARIQELNRQLNAIVTLRLAAARSEAVHIDQTVATGDDPGPLAGVPFTVKDVIATADLPTTCGTRLLADNRTECDAPAVARLRRAGAILLGKSNCPEFAFGVHTDNLLFGRTFSPLAPLTPGGSSGGESAAIAAGMSALGLGTDFGGSLRWPAQCTGVAGLRPTVGRVPASGQLPSPSRREPYVPNAVTMQGRLQVIGPIARTVADLEVALHVIVGPDGADPLAVPVPLGRAASVDPAMVHVRWAHEGFATSPELSAAVRRAATVLSAAGLRTDCSLPKEVLAAADLYTALRNTDPLREIRDLAAGREAELDEGTRRLLAARRPVGEREIATLWAERDRLRAGLLRWLRGPRVLLLPVAETPAYDPRQPVAADHLGEWGILTWSRAISLFGIPAVSVPCGNAQNGQPLAVQVVGPPFGEDVVLAVAQLIESKVPRGSVIYQERSAL